MEPNRREIAAWIISNAKGYELIIWEVTPEREKNTWHGGAIPKEAIAIAHTHPQKDDPQPSKQGIWMVSPDGKITEKHRRKNGQ